MQQVWCAEGLLTGISATCCCRADLYCLSSCSSSFKPCLCSCRRTQRTEHRQMTVSITRHCIHNKHTYVHTHICMYVCMYVCMYACISTLNRTFIIQCMYDTYMYYWQRLLKKIHYHYCITHVHTHTYIHTYIHTNLQYVRINRTQLHVLNSIFYC